jgi:uncharacterized protein (DUF697 family)
MSNSNYLSKDAVALSKEAYTLIDNKAGSNTLIQGLTGLVGFPFTLIADGAVIFTHYGKMLNEVRSLYGRSPVSEEVVIPIVKGISSEILFDIVADKFLGQVPILGIYFNAICAKAMTWRLGVLFTMLASRGEEIDENRAKETAKLIRNVFPQNDTFKFKQPSYATFEKLVVSVFENTVEEYNSKIDKALGAFD